MAKAPKTAAAAPDDSLLNMLAGAQAAGPAPKKGKKDETVWYLFKGVGLMALVVIVATLKWAMNSMKAVLETHEATLKAAAIDEYYVPRGLADKRQPDNIKVESRKFVVGFQLKKRSAASAVNDDDQGILAALKIPLEKDITTPAGLMINPDHLNQEVLRNLMAVIRANPDKLPADLIVPQQEVSKMTVTDESIAAMWKLNERDLRIALPLLTSTAITYGAAPVGEAEFDLLEEILFPEPAAA